MKKDKVLLILVILSSLLIRIIALKTYPPGLYTDESAIGYSAYSILKTGRDEFGNFLPLAFKSFNDYKAPIYIYMVVPFIALLGPKTVSVRLPSAIISTLTVYIVYLLAKKLADDQKKDFNNYFALTTALIFSFCPWHLTFSRIAFEGNISLFFITLGIYLFLVALNKPWLYSLSLISFSLSIYSYHSARLVTPLLFLGLILFNQTRVLKNLRSFLIGCFIALIFSVPLITTTLKNFDEIVRRPANVSIFKDQGITGKLWESYVFDQGQPVVLTKLLHNKPLYYGLTFLKNYFKHFEGGYLFLFGDLGEHFRVPNQGGLLLVSLPFLFIGLVYLIKNRIKSLKIILLWLLLAPIPAAFTFMVPSGHRNLNSIIPLCLITGYGVTFFSNSKMKRIFITVLFCLNIIFFFYQYIYTAPMIMAKEWKYGYEQLVYFVNQNEKNYDKIIFTNESGESYMYYLFFKAYPPDLIQNKLKFDEVDKFGIGHVYKIDNIEFRNIDWKKEILLPRILWIGEALEIPENDNRLNYLKTIYSPNGKKAFVAVDLKSKGQDETRQFQKKDELKLIYSWGECNELGKREELEVNNENKINYRLNINGKPVDEIKLKLTDSESKLIWREIPMDLLENKEINIKIEDINFCNQLNVYKNEKFLRVNMKGKSSPQFDNLLLLLNRLKIKYFNK